MKSLAEIIDSNPKLDTDDVRVSFERVTRKTVMIIVHPEDRDRTFTDDVTAALRKIGFRNVQGRALDELTCDASGVVTGVFQRLGDLLP